MSFLTAVDDQGRAWELSRNLERIPRWGGRTIVPFSVLQHSVLCYNIAKGQEASEYRQLVALLHDIEEGVIGADLSRRYKTDAQREVEDSLRQQLFAEINLPYPDNLDWEWMEGVDQDAAMAEAAVLLRPPESKEVLHGHLVAGGILDPHFDQHQTLVWDATQFGGDLLRKRFVEHFHNLTDTRQVKALRGRSR